jgi:outer membrane receptor protein involved in Fe transport
LITQHTQKFDFLNSKLIVGASIDYSPNDYWSYQIDLAAKLRTDGKSVEKYTITKERPDIKIADYNAKIYNTAAYLQYDFEPIQKLHVSAGLRYDNMSFDYVNNLDVDKTTGLGIGGGKTYTNVTPKLGLTYDLGNSKGVYFNYSQGFAPSGLTAIFRKDQLLLQTAICFTTTLFLQHSPILKSVVGLRCSKTKYMSTHRFTKWTVVTNC